MLPACASKFAISHGRVRKRRRTSWQHVLRLRLDLDPLQLHVERQVENQRRGFVNKLVLRGGSGQLVPAIADGHRAVGLLIRVVLREVDAASRFGQYLMDGMNAKPAGPMNAEYFAALRKQVKRRSKAA